MKKNKMYRPRKKRMPFAVLSILLVLLIGAVSFASAYIDHLITPNMKSIAKIKAEIMVTQRINKAINDQFNQQTDMDKLLIRKVNKEGNMELLQSNTAQMNLLIAQISQQLEHDYQKIKAETVPVPLGSLLGSEILSQAGPKINLKVHPLSVSGTDFKTELESQGINQTKYKVYITLKTQIKVIAPFSSDTFQLSSTVLIAEAVILGVVPNNYVEVPKEDILDVTKE